MFSVISNVQHAPQETRMVTEREKSAGYVLSANDIEEKVRGR